MGEVESLIAIKSQHPGLNSLLLKLHNNISLNDEEISQLSRQIKDLEEQEHGNCSDGGQNIPSSTASSLGDALAGYATRMGTDRFAKRRDRAFSSFYRSAQDLTISSLGIGTYRGAVDDLNDASYAECVQSALVGGINVVDTAINYRHQRSERAVGEGIRRFVDFNAGSRDEVIICTKGGFLTPGAIPTDCIPGDDIVDGMHCMAPRFLADQIGRSRQNLGVETVDIYYIHNPEVQLKSIGVHQFNDRIRCAFEYLESAVADGYIRFYGTATWDGYRSGSLSLHSLVDSARQVAGNNHHFRFIQLPFNLGMREAATIYAGKLSVLDSAADLDIAVVASASLLQGRLSKGLPAEWGRALPGLSTDAQRSIQFTRSSPGIVAALVGMRTLTHVSQNLGVCRVPPLTLSEYKRLNSLINP
jgi:aryl-alcohol dehydrogenase-like predicted oxidoreductase